MTVKRTFVALFFFGLLLIAPPAQAAEPAPAWKLNLISTPTNFSPDSSNEPKYQIVATNIGGAATSGSITVEDTLPAGLTPTEVSAVVLDIGADPTCSVLAQTVSCTTPGPIRPGYMLEVRIHVVVDPLPPASVLNEVSISGGGAASVSAATTTAIDATSPPFGFLAGDAGFNAPLTEADGAASTAAGSHPYQLTVHLGFPFEKLGPFYTVADGGLRDASSDLPRGTIVNPAATPVLCTEVQLVSFKCPIASQIGIATINTLIGGVAALGAKPNRLYNMVPPPGVASSFGFEAVGAGIFVHIVGSVRSDGDFGLTGTTNDVLSIGRNPVLDARIELWGDPAGVSHDDIRDICLEPGIEGKAASCPVPPDQHTGDALLTLPTECTGSPTTFKAHADSWEDPGVFHEATYESADLNGNAVSVDGCNQLEFEPEIEATPTTNLADSPSGLDFKLHQPQNMDLEGRSPAALKDATVTLPPRMVVNASSAQGQAACSIEQIGLKTPIGSTPISFDKQPDSCPDAAKLGTLTATTPLLAEVEPAPETQVGPKGEAIFSPAKVLRDPEGNVIPRPVKGSVYLAEPFDNPFDSLLAIYLSIEDPQSGTVAKFAGEVSADPNTGQLTTVVKDNPQLPIEDIELHFFKGPRASLITPPTCGTHTTTSSLVPWSSPEGADANPSDVFQIASSPDGGTCPTSEAGAPNSPSFNAGTLSSQAAAFSPFVLKLAREDGSQRLARIDTLLPPGMTGKLAGIGMCSEAQVAQALSRTGIDEGAIERSNPSCPASSEVGTVDVAAGAGITPLHTEGKAYLSGPYKGAPLSLTIITPAIAGPFDLGAVTVRTALQLDPKTAQIHAVSDPLPQVIEGIPLNVRSVYLRMGRPDFTLNPTSCDPMAITGSAVSSLGQSATLNAPFQVGGCKALPFKPKLSLRLKGGTKRGGHPKLIATLTAKPGEANISRTSVQLPKSAFLDQSHIGTVCTRVQFSQSACPTASIYGKAEATSPLLDYPIKGNVYLRSSDNPLPDLLIDLRGPEHQPIRIEVAGRTDSVKGALRNTFDVVPDAPVSRFRLELFGGRRGLVINSRDLCARKYRATVEMDGQNGKVHDTTPLVKSDCKKKGRVRHERNKGKKHHHRANKRSVRP